MTTFTPNQRNELIQEWQQAVNRLLAQITDWVEQEPGWQVERSQKEVVEDALGTYQVDWLTIRTPKGRLHVEPIARIVFGGRGTVELYAWPTLFRVRLLRSVHEDRWRIITDSGIALRQEWDRETFTNLVNDLITA